MDNEDDQSGRINQIHEQLLSAYSQFPSESPSSCMLDDEGEGSSRINKKDRSIVPKDDLPHPTLVGLPVSRLRQAVMAVPMLVT